MIDKLESDAPDVQNEPLKPLKKCESRAGVLRVRIKRVLPSNMPLRRKKGHEFRFAALNRTEKTRSLIIRYRNEEPGLVEKINEVLGKKNKLSDNELRAELDNLNDKDLSELFFALSFGEY